MHDVPCLQCGTAMRLHPRQRVWGCPQCGTAAVTFAAAKTHKHPKFVSRLWRIARDNRTPVGRPCSVCSQPLRSVRYTAVDREITLGVCRGCLLIWLDSSELRESSDSIVLDLGYEPDEKMRSVSVRTRIRALR